MSWKDDPKIQRYAKAYDLATTQDERNLVRSMVEREAPAARRRAQVKEEYNQVQAALIGAGSEFARIGEGARMLAGGDQQAIGAERAERERLMGPLNESFPAATMVGETLPVAALPGGAAGGPVRRALTGALTGGLYEGLASGGDATSAAMGGVGAGVGSAAGGALQKWLMGDPKLTATPGGIDDIGEHARKVQQAKAVGMELTPAQRTGNPSLGQVEAGMASSQYSSGPFLAVQQRNEANANRIAREAIGLQGDDLITDEVLETASGNLGAEFTRLVGPDRTFELKPSFYDDIEIIEKEYGKSVTRGDRFKKIADNLRELADNQFISAKEYQEQASDLARASRSAKTGDASGDPKYARALLAAREALDRQFDDQFGDIPALKENRAKYRRLMTLQKPGVIRQGNVSLPSLYNKLKKDDGGRVRGIEAIDTAAKVGHHMASKVPNSGTGTRIAAQQFMAADMLGRAQMLSGNTRSAAYLGSGGLTAGPGAMGYLPHNLVLGADMFGIGGRAGRAAGMDEANEGGRF